MGPCDTWQGKSFVITRVCALASACTACTPRAPLALRVHRLHPSTSGRARDRWCAHLPLENSAGQQPIFAIARTTRAAVACIFPVAACPVIIQGLLAMNSLRPTRSKPTRNVLGLTTHPVPCPESSLLACSSHAAPRHDRDVVPRGCGCSRFAHHAAQQELDRQHFASMGRRQVPSHRLD